MKVTMLSNSKGGVFTARALRDSQSGMWVIRRDALDRILPESDGMAFSEEIKIRAFKCCKCAEVPVKYRKRVGKSKISTALNGIGNLLHLLQLRFINFRGHWRDEGSGNMSKVLARALEIKCNEDRKNMSAIAQVNQTSARTSHW